MVQFSYQTSFKLTQIRRIKKLIDLISTKEGCSISNVSIVFTTDDFLLEINKQYLSHDYFTDIITFDYTDNMRANGITGELYISIDRAKENSKLYGVSTQTEVLRLIIHGILHLCGYGDKTVESKNEMTAKENEYLAFFNVPRETLQTK